MNKKKDKTKSIVALIIAAAGLSFLFFRSSAANAFFSGLGDQVPLFGSRAVIDAGGGVLVGGNVNLPDGWVEYRNPSGFIGIFDKRFYDDNDLAYPAGANS